MCTRIEAVIFSHIESLWNDLSPKMEAKYTMGKILNLVHKIPLVTKVYTFPGYIFGYIHGQVVDTIHRLMKLGVHKMHVIPTSESVIMRTGLSPVGISYRAKLPSKKIMIVPSVRMRPHKYVRRIPK